MGSHQEEETWQLLFINNSFYFTCSKDADAFNPIWVQSSGSQLRFSCLGLVYLKRLANVPKWNTQYTLCSSGVTRLKRTRLDGLKSAIWGATKKSRAKAIISILTKRSANSTTELRKQGRKILCRIRQGSTWNGQLAEVTLSLLALTFYRGKTDASVSIYSSDYENQISLEVSPILSMRYSNNP